VRCADEIYCCGPGSYVFLPRDVPHTFIADGDQPVRMLNISSPGGSEGFFVEAGRPAQAPGLPPEGPLDIDRLRQAREKYGSVLAGPPLTLDADRAEQRWCGDGSVDEVIPRCTVRG